MTKEEIMTIALIFLGSLLLLAFVLLIKCSYRISELKSNNSIALENSYQACQLTIKTLLETK